MLKRNIVCGMLRSYKDETQIDWKVTVVYTVLLLCLLGKQTYIVLEIDYVF